MPVGTTALIVGGLTVAKGYMDYRASKEAAKSATAEGQYQAEVYGRNADLADEQAKDAIARGREAEMSLRRKTRGMVGSQRAALAASGVDINSGSASQVVKNDMALGELDALMIRNNAEREAMGYTRQAEFDRRDAQMALAGGQNRANAIRKEGLGTLLTVGTSLAGTYLNSRSPAKGRWTASGARRGAPL